METNIINVGNSKGIIIPAKLLKMIGLGNVVNVDIEEGKLIISPANKPREGWEDILKNEIEKNGPAKSLAPDFFEDENEDWTW
jgi:antitoxin MazE